MKIEINTGNAAFHAPEGYDEGIDHYVMAGELEKILRSMCWKIRKGETEGVFIDDNGNKCGTWEL